MKHQTLSDSLAKAEAILGTNGIPEPRREAASLVMLALENEFDLEFPDHLLRRESFESIAAIRETIRKIQSGEA